MPRFPNPATLETVVPEGTNAPPVHTICPPPLAVVAILAPGATTFLPVDVRLSKSKFMFPFEVGSASVGVPAEAARD